ncbi:MAG: hypothetical protein D6683_00145 [Actinomyces sp.]|nr:MAG: hypothetical protein D6683_00145 [Actinomyces sp.]
MAITQRIRATREGAPPIDTAAVQLRAFAATGRLPDAEAGPVRVPRSALVLLTAVTVLTAVLCGALVGAADREITSHWASVWAAAAGAGVAAALAGHAAIAAVLRRRRPTVIELRPGAVVEAREIRTGHWLRHEGAWVRVVATPAPGPRHAVEVLVTSGEVLTLDHPVVVAAAPFTPPY